MNNVSFEFPPDTSGQWDGFNDPGIEHFAGNRLQHLGREVPQNTIDAKVGDPAKIYVRLLKVPATTLPGRAELADAVARCRTATETDKSDKAAKFFDEAKRLLGAREISVLQIQDANTTGLVGPCSNGSPFFAMLKATGQSQKPGTATGSYGIGKFAPFAVSEMRTVFISSVWTDTMGVQRHYVQGKAVLMSHLDAKGQTRRGTGFWGVATQCQPVTELIDAIPGWLRMSDPSGSLVGQNGTMISIIGFAADKGWRNVLAANIAENFFGAIHGGELEVIIEGGTTITSTTLETILADTTIGTSVEEQIGEPERFLNATSYLNALKGGNNVVTAVCENLHLGTCELKILLGENLPKRVAVLRNGMLITETLQGLKRLRDFQDFAAVLECKSEKGMALLRAMEPPRHDAFEPDRLPVERRAQGKTALRELADWVRRMLARYAKDPVTEETNLNELADYFGDEAEAGEGRRREENPSSKIIIRARALKLKGVGRATVGSIAEPEADDEGDENEIPGDIGVRPGGIIPDSPPVDGPPPDKPSPEIGLGSAPSKRTLHSGLPLADVRAVLLGPSCRRVAFTPSVTGRLIIELQDSGTDTNRALAVKATSVGKVDAGRVIEVGAQGGVRLRLDIELEAPFVGTLRVVAHAI